MLTGTKNGTGGRIGPTLEDALAVEAHHPDASLKAPPVAPKAMLPRPESGYHRLNVGSGEDNLEGWTNLDIKDGVDIRALPVEDESCDHIRASHCLEHNTMQDALHTLKHWVSKLRPGGTLSVAVPDMGAVGKMLAEDEFHPLLWNIIYGGQTDPADFHHCGFTRRSLTNGLVGFGLRSVRPWYSTINDCASQAISLNLRANKPGMRLTDTAMCMTLPRLGFTETSHCVQSVGAELGVNLSKSTGVFWHHGLTRLVEAAQKHNIKYVLTVDYDSVFTTGDVMLLHDFMEDNGLDAVCPMQSGREMHHILATATDEKGELMKEAPIEMLSKPLMKIRTGHFGLTMLRTEAFAKLEKPWFADKPDPEGGYGEGRIDADIAFWLRWRDAGLSLHMANDCVIGHSQLLVTWPDKQLVSRHQYLNEWTARGKPAWAR